jgi:hypothetical protein
MYPGDPYQPAPSGYAPPVGPPPVAYGPPSPGYPPPGGHPPLSPHAAGGWRQWAPYPGAVVPAHLFGAPPPQGLKIVERARASGAIALPLVGMLFVWLICPTLPWVEVNDDSTSLWGLMDNFYDANGDAKTFGVAYMAGVWILLAFFGSLLAIAGTLDSKGWRWTLASLMALLLLCTVGTFATVAIVIGLAATAGEASGGESHVIGSHVAIAIVGGVIALVVSFAIVFGLFALRGVTYRILAGLALIVAAVVHAAAVASLFPDSVDPEFGAWVSCLGYVLCAIGCFIGPRYERIYALAPRR